jgi:uncharacterized membrane protein YhhN
MKTKVLTVIYILIGITYTVLDSHLSSIPGLVLKGSIIPFLIIIYQLNARQNFRITILAALLFSWAGDVILCFSFIPGLACFLLAHVMYVIAFLKTSGKSELITKRIYLLFPVILYGAGLLCLLYDNLDGMRLPMITYTMVILTMLIAAINRYGKVSRLSFILVLAGAVLFVISDSLIALNKFGFPFVFSGVAVMTTYIAAQYLIVTGVLKQSEKEFV